MERPRVRTVTRQYARKGGEEKRETVCALAVTPRKGEIPHRTIAAQADNRGLPEFFSTQVRLDSVFQVWYTGDAFERGVRR